MTSLYELTRFDSHVFNILGILITIDKISLQLHPHKVFMLKTVEKSCIKATLPPFNIASDWLHHSD